MRQNKQSFQSTRFRTPQHSTQISHSKNQVTRFSPEKTNKADDFYSTQQLQNILSLHTKHSYVNPKQSQALMFACPANNTQQSSSDVFMISKRNRHLERKIATMRQIYQRQQKKLKRLINYSESHINCENNCFKEKYFELLKNIQPK